VRLLLQEVVPARYAHALPRPDGHMVVFVVKDGYRRGGWGG
jgi:hypothetical protein